MSVVIVAFDGAPAVSKEAVDKETALNTLLESRVKGTNIFHLIFMAQLQFTQCLFMSSHLYYLVTSKFVGRGDKMSS